MHPPREARRLSDVARALRLARTLAGQERLPREQLASLQRRALDAQVRHAIARSPYYRERIGDGPTGLRALPVLDKATLMERFDDIVCDRRLRRDPLLAHLEDLDHDVEVEPCAALERPPAGKLQLVVAQEEVAAAT